LKAEDRRQKAGGEKHSWIDAIVRQLAIKSDPIKLRENRDRLKRVDNKETP